MSSRRANPCGICGMMVSAKKSPRVRLLRDDGGFDHAHCSLGMRWDTFAELDKSANRESRRSSQGTKWVRVIDLPGGWQFACRLCGRDFRRHFMAADTNHAEALRLATAYASRHSLSKMHALALGAYRADLHAPGKSDDLLREIFGKQPLSDEQRRRDAARRAAQAFQRSGGKPVD